MIKPNITQGPWKWVGTKRNPTGRHYLNGASYRQVGACLDYNFSEKAEDGEAIAAVPDLLEALELALELVGTAQKHFPKSIKNSDRFQLELSRAAIKKALIKAGYTLD